MRTMSKCMPRVQNHQKRLRRKQGQIHNAHGVAVGDLKMSKNINKYLDMCLKCGKCNDFCPAGIDAVQIINCAKYEYSKGKFSGAIINFLQSRLIFSSFVKLGKILSRPFRKRFQNKKNTLKVMYFKSVCVNEVFPQNDNYLYKIFNNSDIEIITPDFDCADCRFFLKATLNVSNRLMEKILNTCNPITIIW